MFTPQTITTTTEARRRSSAAPRPQAVRSTEVRATSAIGAAIVRVAGEYREMPGLSLTLPQAARLLGLERSTCELVLAHLIDRRVLKRAPNGTYIRR
jgi:hypothetical protein